MPVTFITSDAAYDRLNKPFNPPVINSPEDEAAFISEWDGVRERLMQTLDALGEWNAYGEGDYYIGDQVMQSRGIGIELTSDMMLDKKLIPLIQSSLHGCTSSYEVYCSFLHDHHLWNFFITEDRTMTDCTPEILEHFL
ncbi:MAG TPA: hypothetical protein DCP71_04405 [Verrucomicrobiales bacterium]|jgi:hypothetical protein|nr:hypothetical protein [Verrucomicrobiales bacterium]